MKFCPKKFGHDMTDPGNLDYCRSIQSKDQCESCDHYEHSDSVVEKREDRTKKSSGTIAKQGKLF